MGGRLASLRLRLAERRTLRQPAVELCERLRYEGWEHLHDAALVLLAPAGSRRVARRVLELFLDGREAIDAELVAAEKALDENLEGVWMVAEPEAGGRWIVRFLPPVAAAPHENAGDLARRYRQALDDWTRRRGA